MLADLVNLAVSRDCFRNLTNIEIHAEFLNDRQILDIPVKPCSTGYPGRYIIPDAKIYERTERLASICDTMGIVLTIQDVRMEGHLQCFRDFYFDD